MRGSLLLVMVLVVLLATSEAAKKKKKKPSKKPAAKGACTTSGTKLTATNTAEYTDTGDCPCWWDITKTNCACCKEGADAMQCGWPMHKFCYKKSDLGCPGVCNNRYTLSGKGYPCFSDLSSTNCAWCSKDGYQCEQNTVTGPDSQQGSRCQSKTDTKYCKSQQGDCKHIPACDVNASCNFLTKVGKYGNYFGCECNEGWQGNGIQCMDEETGELSENPALEVEVTLTLSSKLYEANPVEGQFSPGAELQSLISSMQSAASSCEGDDCEASFNLSEA